MALLRVPRWELARIAHTEAEENTRCGVSFQSRYMGACTHLHALIWKLHEGSEVLKVACVWRASPVPGS